MPYLNSPNVFISVHAKPSPPFPPSPLPPPRQTPGEPRGTSAAGYELMRDADVDTHVFQHLDTGIKVWSHALELTLAYRISQNV